MRYNLFQNRLAILQHIVVPESDNLEPHFHQVFGTFFLPVFPFRMLPAIDLKDNHFSQVYEIGNIWADGPLSSKFKAGQVPVSQMPSKPSFGIGHVFSQRTGVILCMLLTLFRHLLTLTPVRRPLPNWEREMIAH